MSFNRLKRSYHKFLSANDSRWGNNPNPAIRDTYNTLTQPLHTIDNRISEAEQTYNEIRGIGDHISHNFKRQKTSHPSIVTQSQDTTMSTLRRRQPKHVLHSRIRRVERMARGELKCIDVTANVGDVTTSSIEPLSIVSAINRGTEGSNRIGDTIHIKKIEVSGWLGNTDGQTVHIIRPNSISIPTNGDFTLGGSGITYRHEAGWELLRDTRDDSHQYTRMTYNFKRPMKVRFDDDTVVLNNLWFCAGNVYGSTQPGADCNVKLWFYDN